jgi:hypothetical protein
MANKRISILFPRFDEIQYVPMSETACHDLGLDTLCKTLTSDTKEQRYIMSVLSNTTDDPYVASFRQEVFADILGIPELRKRITELFDKLEFMRSFGGMAKKTDEKLGIWYLMHRLDELDDYIKCVESMRECLSDDRIKSEGLISFRKHIEQIYEDSCFAQMRKDIGELKVKSSEIKSITL